MIEGAGLADWLGAASDSGAMCVLVNFWLDLTGSRPYWSTVFPQTGQGGAEVARLRSILSHTEALANCHSRRLPEQELRRRP